MNRTHDDGLRHEDGHAVTTSVRFTHRVTVWIGGKLNDLLVADLTLRHGGVTIQEARGTWIGDDGKVWDEVSHVITVLVADVRAANLVITAAKNAADFDGEEAIAFTIDETSGGIR